MNILEILPSVQENVTLANHTTFRIGGLARYFFVAENKKEIMQAVKAAKENGLPFFLLGGGSNLLVSDEGFNGLIIRMSNGQYTMTNGRILADSGASFVKIILDSTKQGYSGLEWGFGIPGTIGGAIYGNAHRLGQAISQVVESMEVLDSDNAIKTLTKDECEFVYGGSRFKKTEEIILSVILVLEKKEQKIIEEVLEEAKKIVRHHPPNPSAGCVFRNYETQGKNDPLLSAHPELISRVRGGKIGVGYLIDQCGLRGKQAGGAKIWEGHANFIINLGEARAEDVIALINLCKEKVKEKFGIELEEEIRYLGFEDR